MATGFACGYFYATIFNRMKVKIYDKSQIDFDHLLFTPKKLWKIIIPVMAEQVLNSFMGLMDTMMVSRVGSVAMSAVSLSDTINMLLIMVFSALAAGGTIVCSNYIGQQDEKKANKAAEQVFLAMLFLSLAVTLICVGFRRPLLSLIFGQIEADVMNDALIYFAITAASYPFIALFSSGSAFFRASGNTKFPMKISIISNVINVGLNAVFIFACGWGVMGAALATLISRVFSMVAVHIGLARPRQIIVLKNYTSFRPDWALLKKILSIGIPSGIENGMFQFGKLVIQSSVSTLGTTAIAAQAMTNIFENVNGVCAQGVGIALLTVAGYSYGAGRKEETRYYIAKMCWYAEIVMIISCLLTYAASNPVMMLAGMEIESAKLCHYMLLWITIIKPMFWVLSFTLPSGLKACLDVRFTMTVSVCTMWLLRVMVAVVLIRVFGFGPIAVWIGMFCDWFLRGCIFSTRFLSGKFYRK